MMPTAQATTVVKAKVQHRKAAHLPRRRGGHKHEEDDVETVATDESYTDDSGLSEEEGFSDDETEEEYEDASDGAGRKVLEEKQASSVVNGDKHRRTDTDVMKNGMDPEADEGDVINFEDMGDPLPANGKEIVLEVRESAPVPPPSVEPLPASQRSGGKKATENVYERKRREHEEYKRRRAEDPSFVPNRGRFFMHDHRDGGGGSNGFRPFGRGRGGRFGDFQSQHPPPPELAAEWPHDMHEQIEAQNESGQVGKSSGTSNQTQNQQSQQNPVSSTSNSHTGGRPRVPEQPRSFGRTLHKGTVQIQVNLPGMKAPITFSEVPLKVYTRLPYHRPPLRRDKPVRIALSDAPVRYIYPNVQRSFIFIPRAMRPGGSGYVRGSGARGRGGYPSGGRSFYGGGSTIYSPSIGMSRRSSVQYDTQHHTPSQHIYPPVPNQMAVAGYVEERQTRPVVGGDEESGRPIVRLPNTALAPSSNVSHSSQQPLVPGKAPTPRAAPQHPPPSYTPLINPIPYRETRATPKIPMYQPRPQKAVNVAEIDSPAVMHFPQNYNGGVYTEQIPAGTPVMAASSFAQHSRHPSHPSQTSGTPLSQIPEAAHARPFHPNPYSQQPYYQPYVPLQHQAVPPPTHPIVQQPPLQPHHGVYHPPPPPPYVAGHSPMPNGTPVVYHMSSIPHQPTPSQISGPPGPGPTTIAQESNGMVYYSTWDFNAAYYPYPATGSGLAYPGTPGGLITPVPDSQGQNVSGTMYYFTSPPGPGYYPGQNTNDIGGLR